jgi:hypothetical protein
MGTSLQQPSHSVPNPPLPLGYALTNLVYIPRNVTPNHPSWRIDLGCDRVQSVDGVKRD